MKKEQTTDNLSFIERKFEVSKLGTSLKQEIIAGITTFLAMVYSAVAVPSMLADVGFSQESVFIATVLMTAFGSILIGYCANLPMAIGGDIALCAFIAYSLVGAQGMPPATALACIFALGIVFLIFSVSGARAWMLRNLPSSVAHGTGIGVGLFLLLIAASNVHMVIPSGTAIPIKFGDFSSLPVLLTLLGLFLVIALEAIHVKGGILIVMIFLTIVGVVFDPNVQYSGLLKIPSFGEKSHFLGFDLESLLDPKLLPIIFALTMTSVFDATGTIRAVAGQAGLVKADGTIKGGNAALTSDSLSTVVSGLVGTIPAAVYIESAAGTAAGGRSGITAITVGVLFLFILLFQPIALLVPTYATAPALMYVGLLMLGNVKELNFKDQVGFMSGLISAVFIILSANIVTGIMLGFCSIVIGRVVTRDWARLNVGTVLIAIGLFAYYVSGLAL